VVANAGRRAHAGQEREPRVVLRDGIVELAHHGAGVDPRRRQQLVDGHGDGAEAGEVDHPEHLPRFQRPVGQALVVVAAVAHAEAHAVHAAAQDGGLCR
jgi:hypothetical protein